MKKNLLFLTITILLCLLLIELILQYISPPILVGVGTFRGSKSNILGWAPFPNKQYTFVNPDTSKVSYFTTNSQGWKDVEHHFDKPDDVVRILFIGDSVTWGYVYPSDLYTRQVERLLTKRLSSKVEVISIGVYAWGTDQALEVLQVEGLKYHPDIVVYQFTLNDVIDNTLPNETTKPGDAYLSKTFRYEIVNGVLEKRKLEPTPNRKIKNFLLRSAIAYNLNIVRYKIIYHFRKINDRKKVRDRWREIAYNPESPHFLFSRDKEPERVKNAWKLLEALIAKMKLVSEKNNSRLIIFAVFGDNAKRARDIKRKRFHTDGSSDYVMKEGQRYLIDYKRPLKNLSKICERNDILIIKPVRQYDRYDNDGHPNAIGNKRMAQDVVEFFLAQEMFQRITEENR
ncbi:MAG: SGNH/GDSL hydrolase family protein [bacterium]|nr:SGNH/GDSL hydrolase family protein [bacterium]